MHARPMLKGRACTYQPKIEEEADLIVIQAYAAIGRFDVTVYVAKIMHRLQSVYHLDAQEQRGLQR